MLAQRKLYGRALGHGAERMGDDRAVRASVDPRGRVDRWRTATGTHMSNQQIGEGAAAGELPCLFSGTC